MPRRRYRITRGTELTPTPDGRYAIQAPGKPVATLDAPALAPLLLIDGKRGEGEIEHDMSQQGAALPSGVLGGILSSLGGVLGEVWAFLGTSCEGLGRVLESFPREFQPCHLKSNFRMDLCNRKSNSE